ncbi:sensor histidine kinase [Vagococcus fluvialis]|uniref:sensor histidine kinase n=1 Tax=Vagococcus fluvialis TaxID=2738 RepID=UPI001D09C5A3|nr:HAMP domain-containing sensor histidine kinase [Vagococcus fluvialis]MDT2782136.1 HAMP domain-containing sensor histidine kinase [Vagococcus fluvialis]UDM71515.1 HAMP domain-containing histidine kinase [Vagococcus fluvialis]UDM76376.1 HAMP domain-containing histidine kinase [Vagococcus fluvialis]UDM80606.1 HAMP domain-containing histidine kinase [Vagococcus fluvialis]UDM83207.1 HAMP domain-containing histidine kinase [Vagococcus fluvialis]
MATKWKNSLLLIFAVIFCLGGWFTTYVSSNRMNTVDNIFYEMNNNVVESVYLKENLADFKPTKIEDISPDQVEIYRQRYGDLGTQILDIKSQYQERLELAVEEKTKETLQKERDDKIKAIVENFTDDEAVKKKIIDEEMAYIKKNKKTIEEDIKPYLSDANELYHYFFKDTQTGDVYTNVEGLNKYSTETEVRENLKSQAVGKVKNFEYGINLYNFIKPEATQSGLFQTSVANLKGSYVIPKGSFLDTKIKEQEKEAEFFSKLIYVGIFSMLIGIGILYFYVNSKMLIDFMNKIPLDVATVVFLGLGFVAAAQALVIYPYNVGNSLRNMRMLVSPVVIGTACLLISFVMLKVLWQKLLPKYRKVDLKEVWQDSAFYKLYEKIISIFNKLPFSSKIVVILLVVVANLFALFILRRMYFSSFYRMILLGVMVVVILVEIRLVYLALKRTKKIMEQSKNWMVEYDQPVSQDTSLKELDRELTQLNKLIEASQKDTVQSEMLKTELLTNVSHDLRTPLTSIITYGDLLKQESLTDDNRKEYIEIINKKAQRMKHLIDDLFEVTKMNNGEIILDKSEVNLTQLLQQSVSEYSEEFEDHHLKFIFNKPEEAINLPLDGERMWRVFDNIFGNAIKYSMPETRVYLKLEKQNDMAKIELKNISQHELNEEADQLMEKFKRGDSSRHTEGSGLGLAIINSIVSLHDGNIDIQVDGDLFKLTIYLPLH